MEKVKKLLTTILLSLILLVPMVTFAQRTEYLKGVSEVVDSSYGREAGATLRADDMTIEQSLYVRIGQVINIVLGTIGTIILIVIIYAGFLWLTAGGNEEQVAKAKKWIFNGIIGVIIITAAFFISDFILEVATKTS